MTSLNIQLMSKVGLIQKYILVPPLCSTPRSLQILNFEVLLSFLNVGFYCQFFCFVFFWDLLPLGMTTFSKPSLFFLPPGFLSLSVWFQIPVIFFLSEVGCFLFVCFVQLFFFPPFGRGYLLDISEIFRSDYQTCLMLHLHIFDLQPLRLSWFCRPLADSSVYTFFFLSVAYRVVDCPLLLPIVPTTQLLVFFRSFCC